MPHDIPTAADLIAAIRAEGVKDLRNADRRETAYEAIRGLVHPRSMPIVAPSLAPKTTRTVGKYAEWVVGVLRHAERMRGVVPAPAGLH